MLLGLLTSLLGARALLGARTLLGAPGLTTRCKDATIGLLALLPGARTLLGAPGLTTRSKNATRAPLKKFSGFCRPGHLHIWWQRGRKGSFGLISDTIINFKQVVIQALGLFGNRIFRSSCHALLSDI